MLTGPEGSLSVTATPDDDLQVDGHALEGTAVIGRQQLLRFSPTVTARVGREVDGTWYLQVFDTGSPHLAAFAGLERYDVDPAWVLEARYVSRAEADRPTVAGRLGSEELHRRSSPGDVELTLEGRQHRLAVHASFAPDRVTVNSTDETSGSQTPSAGRVPVLERPGEAGPVVLDLNATMLLPHESSPVHPCPVPPAGNHLPVAVTAGERALRSRG